MQTILITGATGGLGGSVARNLKEKQPNATIAVLVRDVQSEKAKQLEDLGFELRQANYNDASSLEQAFENVNLLYFVSGSDIAYRTPQHKNIVEAAKNANVNHIVYTSAVTKGLKPNMPLYESLKIHQETEDWIKDTGINYTILRHNLYAEVIAMFLGTKEQLLQSKTVFLPTKEGATAFVTREDMAEAGAVILANPSAYSNQTLEFSASESITFAEIAKELSNVTKETIAYVSPEIPEFEKTMAQYGVPEEYIGMMSSFSDGIAQQVFNSSASETLESILGRKTLPVKSFLSQVYG